MENDIKTAIKEAQRALSHLQGIAPVYVEFWKSDDSRHFELGRMTLPDRSLGLSSIYYDYATGTVRLQATAIKEGE